MPKENIPSSSTLAILNDKLDKKRSIQKMNFCAVLVVFIFASCQLFAANQTNIAVRRTFPPSNWTVPFDTVQRPYEDFVISIAGPDFQMEDWRLSGDTKIDGKEIRDDPQPGHLDIQGWGNSQTRPAIQQSQQGIQLVVSYLPVFQFPKSFGKHPVDLVISTASREYHFRRFIVRLDATKEERKQLRAFERSGADAFLNNPYGFTPPDSNNKKSVPYAEVLTFVKEYPDSYLTDLIERRIKLIWLWDVNEKGVPDDERLWMGKILGAIDKTKYLAEFQKDIQDKVGLQISRLWLDAVATYPQTQ